MPTERKLAKAKNLPNKTAYDIPKVSRGEFGVSGVAEWAGDKNEAENAPSSSENVGRGTKLYGEDDPDTDYKILYAIIDQRYRNLIRTTNDTNNLNKKIMATKFEEHDKRFQDLQRDLAKAVLSAENRDKDYKNLEKQTSDLNEDLKQAKARIKSFEEDAKKVKEEEAKREAHIRKVEDEIVAQEGRVEEVARLLGIKDETIRRVTAERDRAKHTIENLRKDAQQRDADNQGISSQLNENQLELQRLTAANSQMAATVDSLRQAEQDLNAERDITRGLMAQIQTLKTDLPQFNVAPTAYQPPTDAPAAAGPASLAEELAGLARGMESEDSRSSVSNAAWSDGEESSSDEADGDDTDQPAAEIKYVNVPVPGPTVTVNVPGPEIRIMIPGPVEIRNVGGWQQQYRNLWQFFLYFLVLLFSTRIQLPPVIVPEPAHPPTEEFIDPDLAKIANLIPPIVAPNGGEVVPPGGTGRPRVIRNHTGTGPSHAHNITGADASAPALAPVSTPQLTYMTDGPLEDGDQASPTHPPVYRRIVASWIPKILKTRLENLNEDELPPFWSTILELMFHFIIYYCLFTFYSTYCEREMWIAANDVSRSSVIRLLGHRKRYPHGFLHYVFSDWTATRIDRLTLSAIQAFGVEIKAYPLPG